GDPTIESHEIEISSMKYRTHEINIGSLNSLENIARKYATSFNGIDDLMIYCYNFLILLTMPIAKSSKTKDQLLLSGYRYRRANKSQIIWLCC
ncbi:unnamed protein product, partial [Rotaria socialis]